MLIQKKKWQKGECRKQETNVHNPNGAKLCQNCKHYALTDDKNNCECCGLHIKNNKKFTEIKTFEKITKIHIDVIREWIAFPSGPDYNFGWPVRIGIINYFVPVRYFAEYLELPDLEGEKLTEKFLENVKKECPVLGRYMHAIK